MRWLKNRLIRWLGAKWYVQRVTITEAPWLDDRPSCTPKEIEHQATRAIERLIKDLKHTGRLQWIELPPTEDPSSDYHGSRHFVLKIRVI